MAIAWIRSSRPLRNIRWATIARGGIARHRGVASRLGVAKPSLEAGPLLTICVRRFCATQANLELAAKMVKEYMDRKYNENWIVIIGKDFAFECTHEVKHVLWMFICDVSCLCYKAGARQVGTL